MSCFDGNVTTLEDKQKFFYLVPQFSNTNLTLDTLNFMNLIIPNQANLTVLAKMTQYIVSSDKGVVTAEVYTQKLGPRRYKINVTPFQVKLTD